jgi:DMSO/TMAO reductase YedYZ molybdopterin-dependent catalytic subunit
VAESTTPRVFSSTLRDQRTAALLGLALGVSFTVCFLTGVLSHLIQDPPSWFQWPSRPAGLYRVTQGVHVATGLASIPLLLAKLWVVYPKLFSWPPFESAAHLVERLAIFPLVAAAVFELFTGLADTHIWYPWPFNFRTAHYWVAWILIGALVVHLGAKWSITRVELFRRKPSDAYLKIAERPSGTHLGTPSAFDRRTFLATVFAAAGAVTVFTVGQTVAPLRKLALLAPRRPDSGPQGFPVNRTAATAGVVESARSPDYRFRVEGKVRERLEFTREELLAMPQHEATLPISCVEGWSTTQRWRGVRVRDLLERAGSASDADVRVDSLQRRRAYRSSDLNRSQTHDPDTLLALAVNGEPLDIDHGFPLRLIGPNRPGVQQTKWVTRLVVR